MTIRNMINSAPAITRPLRFFTMVNTNSHNETRGTNNEEVITDLIIQENGRASYTPGTPGSIYAAGAINSRLFGEDLTQTTWANPQPVMNNAIVNQQDWLASVGSVSMLFNTSQAQMMLTDTVRTILALTPDIDPILMTSELEKAICEAAIRYPRESDFVTALTNQYRELYNSAEVLGQIYSEMQFIRSVTENGFDTLNQVAHWDTLTSATDPMNRINTNFREEIDPIADTSFEPVTITPAAIAGMANTAPMIYQYVDTTGVVNNAIPVNTIVVVAAATTPSASPSDASRSQNVNMQVNLNVGAPMSGGGY